jgi:hypothetical protein
MKRPPREKTPGSSGGGGPQRDPVPPAMRKVVARAVRRLEVFEWVILFGVAVFSVAGGALVAVLAAEVAGLSFRFVWILASIGFFGIPGWLVLWRGRE